MARRSTTTFGDPRLYADYVRRVMEADPVASAASDDLPERRFQLSVANSERRNFNSDRNYDLATRRADLSERRFEQSTRNADRRADLSERRFEQSRSLQERRFERDLTNDEIRNENQAISTQLAILNFERQLRNDHNKLLDEQTKLQKTVETQRAVSEAVTALRNLDYRSPDYRDKAIEIRAKYSEAFEGNPDLIRPATSLMDRLDTWNKEHVNSLQSLAERRGKTIEDLIEETPEGTRRYNPGILTNQTTQVPEGLVPSTATVNPRGEVTVSYSTPTAPKKETYADIREEISTRYGYDLPPEILFDKPGKSKYLNDKNQEVALPGEATKIEISYNYPGKGEVATRIPMDKYMEIRKEFQPRLRNIKRPSLMDLLPQ